MYFHFIFQILAWCIQQNIVSSQFYLIKTIVFPFCGNMTRQVIIPPRTGKMRLLRKISECKAKELSKLTSRFFSTGQSVSSPIGFIYTPFITNKIPIINSFLKQHLVNLTLCSSFTHRKFSSRFSAFNEFKSWDLKSGNERRLFISPDF